MTFPVSVVVPNLGMRDEIYILSSDRTGLMACTSAHPRLRFFENPFMLFSSTCSRVHPVALSPLRAATLSCPDDIPAACCLWDRYGSVPMRFFGRSSSSLEKGNGVDTEDEASHRSGIESTKLESNLEKKNQIFIDKNEVH